MEKVKIVCPSHGRADRVLSVRAVSDLILCVAESQADEYREHNPDNEIITHPDDVKGLTPKRDWMYKNLGSLFMVDDDIAGVRDMSAPKGADPKISPDVAAALIHKTAELAHEMGVFLFGFNHTFNPMMYKPQIPFALTGYIPGHAMGVLGPSKLFWHHDAKTVCDFWISALNAFHYRMVLKDLRYAFVQKDTFTNRGGLAEHRTMDVEHEGNALLKEYFGSAIGVKKGTHAAKLKHAAQRNLKIPF